MISIIHCSKAVIEARIAKLEKRVKENEGEGKGKGTRMLLICVS